MRATEILTAIVVSCAIILTSFVGLTDTGWFTEHELKKTGALERLPEAVGMHRQITVYILGKGKELPEVLNEREKLHLEDVRKLVSKATVTMALLDLAAAALLTWAWKKKRLAKTLVYCGGAIIFACAALYLLSFSSLFDSFHRLLFEEGTYIFNETDTLIALYPFEFFQGFAYTALILSLALGLVMAGFGLLGQSQVKWEKSL